MKSLRRRRSACASGPLPSSCTGRATAATTACRSGKTTAARRQGGDSRDMANNIKAKQEANRARREREEALSARVEVDEENVVQYRGGVLFTDTGRAFVLLAETEDQDKLRKWIAKNRPGALVTDGA